MAVKERFCRAIDERPALCRTNYLVLVSNNYDTVDMWITYRVVIVIPVE